MEVSLEHTSTIGRKMIIKVSAEKFDNSVELKLKKMSKIAKVPGFRPGKVPMKVIESRYLDQALAEAADELIQSSYQEALAEKSINAVGPPSIEPKALSRGADLEYAASFEVFPEIPKSDIKGSSIETLSCEIKDEDVERTITTLMNQRTEYIPSDVPAESGDRVTIDFEGKVNGDLFEGGSANDYPIVLGRGALLPDFESNLVGARSGDHVDFKLTFPESYPGPEVAGKETDFSVSVKEVGKPQLPSINEEFIRGFGIADGKEETFREEIQKTLERERDQRSRNQTRQAVIDALLENNEFEVPSALVNQEVNRAIMSLRQQLKQQGLPDDKPIDRNHYVEDCTKRVRLGLAMYEVIKKRKITPDDEKVRARLIEMSSGYDKPEQVISWYYEDKKRLAEIESIIVEEQAIDSLLEEAQVTEKVISFEEMVNPSSKDLLEDVADQENN